MNTYDSQLNMLRGLSLSVSLVRDSIQSDNLLTDDEVEDLRWMYGRMLDIQGRIVAGIEYNPNAEVLDAKTIQATAMIFAVAEEDWPKDETLDLGDGWTLHLYIQDDDEPMASLHYGDMVWDLIVDDMSE